MIIDWGCGDCICWGFNNDSRSWLESGLSGRVVAGWGESRFFHWIHIMGGGEVSRGAAPPGAGPGECSAQVI